MTEAMPYLNIYPTEEIPEDMKAEVEAEQAAQQGSQEGAAEEEEETQVPEGSLVDPQTGEVVQMPDPEEVDEDSPYLGGAGDGLLTGIIDTSEEDDSP